MDGGQSITILHQLIGDSYARRNSINCRVHLNSVYFLSSKINNNLTCVCEFVNTFCIGSTNEVNMFTPSRSSPKMLF